VQTHFRSLMTQTPAARRLAPMEVEELETSGPSALVRVRARGRTKLLSALLPKYINTRIYAALLDSRQRVGRPAAGHEERHGQRGRDDQEPDPGD
jgi:F0F1-type ATP synthase gamma subunit